MWHEARKQEKKIREVMVDFQRRAERRREHYDKMRADPTSYLKIVGRKCQLHLDPTGGERDSSMIPWQGDPDNLISRYDVRMHMDIIPDYSKLPKSELTNEGKQEETKYNYERYRSVIMNEFNNVPESDALAKIEVDEMFSDVKKNASKDKKKLAKSKAAIGYNYGQGPSCSGGGRSKNEEDDLSDGSDYEMDYDIDTLSTRQIDRVNVVALEYGVTQGYFSRTLRAEKNILMQRKQAKIAEMEKSAFSGKKARRERRLYKDLVLQTRPGSPPLFMRQDNPSYETYHDDRSGSSSRSTSPEGEMQFITEFGSDNPPSSTSHTTSTVTTPSSLGERKKTYQQKNPDITPTSRTSRWSSCKRHRSRSHSKERSHRSQSQERHKMHSFYEHRRNRSRSRSRERVVSALTKNKLEAKKQTSNQLKQTPSSHLKEVKKLTPQERLKRKMQSQLSKTFKEDKKIEKIKAEAKEVERIEREEKLKEETYKLKERERHRLGHSPTHYHSHSRSPSPFNYRY